MYGADAAQGEGGEGKQKLEKWGVKKIVGREAPVIRPIKNKHVTFESREEIEGGGRARALRNLPGRAECDRIKGKMLENRNPVPWAFRETSLRRKLKKKSRPESMRGKSRPLIHRDFHRGNARRRVKPGRENENLKVYLNI